MEDHDNMEETLEEEPHLKEEGMEEEEETFCVVCLSKISSLTSGGDYVYRDNLSKNLDVIFLLKHLMQVPSILLKNNLKDCGNPGDWGMSLCENCIKLKDQAKCFHLEILNIESKLKLVQQLILDKVRRLSSESEWDIHHHQHPVSLNDKQPDEILKKNGEFWRRARYFVKNYSTSQRTPVPVNPFIKGDQLAKYLKSWKSLSSVILDDKQPTSNDDNQETIGIQIKREFLNELEDNFEDDPSSPSIYQAIVEDKPVEDKLSILKRKKSGKHVRTICEICGEKFQSKKGLSKHLIQDHDKMLVSCYLCGVGLKDDPMLKIHLLEEHKDEDVVRGWKRSNYWNCQVKGCEMKYTRATGLGEHWGKMHQGNEWGEWMGQVEKRFKCGICGKGFWNDAKRRRHELIHKRRAVVEDTRCGECGREFWRRVHLESHKWKEHVERGR